MVKDKGHPSHDGCPLGIKYKTTQYSYSSIPHELLQFLLLCLSEWWCWLFVVIIFEQHRKHILNGFSLWVTHRVDAGIYHLSEQLVGEGAALTVASDDATDLPEREVIHKGVVVDSYLAHE